MNLTPEQQKELIEASLKLASLAKRNTDDADEWDAAISAVEKFRPKPEKPKLLEGWVNEYPTPSLRIWPSPDAAIRASSEEATRTAVHMREVVPPDEGLRWRAYGSLLISRGLTFAIARCDADAGWIADAHNAALGFGKEGE